jgi:hypothetical protein
MQELSKLDLTGLACRASSHIGMTWRASPCTCSRCHEAERIRAAMLEYGRSRVGPHVMACLRR